MPLLIFPIVKFNGGRNLYSFKIPKKLCGRTGGFARKHTTYKKGDLGNGLWHCFTLCISHFVPLQHGYGAHVCLCRDGCLQHRQDSDGSRGGTGESPAETGAQGWVFIGKDMGRSRDFHRHVYVYIYTIIWICGVLCRLVHIKKDR